MIEALWLYMPPYVNNTNEIIITSITSTETARRRLLSTAGNADVTTEFDVGNANSVAATGSHLSSVVAGTQFLVSQWLDTLDKAVLF